MGIALAFARRGPSDVGPDIAYAIVTMADHRRPHVVGELAAALRIVGYRAAQRCESRLLEIAGRAYAATVYGIEPVAIRGVSKRDFEVLTAVAIAALLRAADESVRRAEMAFYRD